MAQNSSTERMGVLKCAVLFEENGFVFREQSIVDYGIDAIIESKEGNRPSGKMIAVQIKSGESYFKEIKDDYVIYRVDEKHKNYWINHSLPVIIVLYSPSRDECIWEIVNKQTLISSKKQWLVRIPNEQTISKSQYKLQELAENISEYEHRWASLVFAKEWMLETRKNGFLILEVQEWINKSSGRGRFILKTFDDKENEKILFDRELWGFGLKNYEDVIREMFPWAIIEIDKEFYEEYKEPDYYSSYFGLFSKLYNELNGVSTGSVITEPDGIYPYHTASGEVDFYRLILKINPVGEAFLLMEDFLENGKFYCIDHLQN